MTCPHCGARMTGLDHGICSQCGKNCGCSFNPTTNNDWCEHHFTQLRNPNGYQDLYVLIRNGVRDQDGAVLAILYTSYLTLGQIDTALQNLLDERNKALRRSRTKTDSRTTVTAAG